MTWAAFDDNFPDHPKIKEVGPLAAWLFTTSVCYSNRYLTDGFIKGFVVSTLIDLDIEFPTFSRVKLERRLTELVDRLVDSNLWEIVDGGYQIHDFLRYQRSAQVIMEQRDRNRNKSQRYRDKGVRDRNVTGYAPVRNPNVTGNSRARVSPSPSPSPGDPSNMYISSKKNGQEDDHAIPGIDSTADSPNLKQAEVDRFADERASNRRRRRTGGVPEV